MDFSAFPLPKPRTRPKSEVKKDGRVVLKPGNYRKLKKKMFFPGIICTFCDLPIWHEWDFTLEHYDGRGAGGGRRDDRKVSPAHFCCNTQAGSPKRNVTNGKKR